MLVFTHPSCLLHDPGAGHPECPQRLQHVLDALHAAFPGQLDWREAPLAFCARPPTTPCSDGFCLLSRQPRRRDRHGLERIAVVDFDVHHGNGTGHLPARRPGVLQHPPGRAVPIPACAATAVRAT